MKFQGELGLGFLNRAVGRRAALLADVGDLDHASIEEVACPVAYTFYTPGKAPSRSAVIGPTYDAT